MPAFPDISAPQSSASSTARAYARLIGEAVAETLWPTRCALCDVPGAVLCPSCRLRLPFIDQCRACPRCGAPFGRIQCTECNNIMLAASGREALPYDGCVCATTFDETAARVVRTWKDAGERRLKDDMADLMAAAVPPEWLRDLSAVVCVPASGSALRQRGFDHGQLLGAAVAGRLGLPCVPALARPRSADQRQLGRRARLSNTSGRFMALPGASVPKSVLLVDDVYTTGATLFSACDALREAQVQAIRCVTFARV